MNVREEKRKSILLLVKEGGRGNGEGGGALNKNRRSNRK